jgi:hypothetical protein
VPAERVLAALEAAGGKEVESGKFANPESSAALACNTFGWFLERPGELPPLPGLEGIDWPATVVAVERCLRFPWQGGRHPWLDAVIETSTNLIGVESKRFEPFRDTKTVNLSAAYDRPVWGPAMAPFERLRDGLRRGSVRYSHLDAAQLLKHAFGLVTQGKVLGKTPILYYFYAEPAERSGKAIPQAMRDRHRAEIDDFANRVAGAAVRFASSSYRDWLSRFEGNLRPIGNAIIERFAP